MNELETFSKNNPCTEITETETAYKINKPWNDESLSFEVPKGKKEIIEALNSLILPHRYSGIFHNDKNTMEFIFTTDPSLKYIVEVKERKFKFRFQGSEYECEYNKSSEQLLIIAEISEFVGHSETDYRNLPEFSRYVRMRNRKPELVKDKEPYSFWIKNFPLNPITSLELVNNLNFYMKLYDQISPAIFICEEEKEEKLDSPKLPHRFLYGKFPEIISGKKIDSFLLELWRNAQVGNPMFRFLNNYQVLEYAGFYFLKDETKTQLEKILAKPDLPSKVNIYSKKIMDLMVENNTKDEIKMEKLIQSCVDVETLWKEIEVNRLFFQNETEFEGGFKVGPLITEKSTCSDFERIWGTKLFECFKKIRNALVHSRELRQVSTIMNSVKNTRLIRPWLWLISITTKEILTFSKNE
jgi:hypothetical protein